MIIDYCRFVEIESETYKVCRDTDWRGWGREREKEIRRGIEQLSISQDSGGVGAVGEKRIRNN